MLGNAKQTRLLHILSSRNLTQNDLLKFCNKDIYGSLSRTYAVHCKTYMVPIISFNTGLIHFRTSTKCAIFIFESRTTVFWRRSPFNHTNPMTPHETNVDLIMTSAACEHTPYILFWCIHRPCLGCCMTSLDM